jgi:hypothetical protein
LIIRRSLALVEIANVAPPELLFTKLTRHDAAVVQSVEDAVRVAVTRCWAQTGIATISSKNKHNFFTKETPFPEAGEPRNANSPCPDQSTT